MRKRRAEQGFQLRDNGELVCRAGHTLKRSLAHYTEDETWLYSAKVSACSDCRFAATCLPPKSRRRFVYLSEYEREFDRAAEKQNRSLPTSAAAAPYRR